MSRKLIVTRLRELSMGCYRNVDFYLTLNDVLYGMVKDNLFLEKCLSIP